MLRRGASTLTRKRVVVLGGTGLFGSRLIELLQRQRVDGALLDIVCASRSCRQTTGVEAVQLDIDAPDFPQRLCALSPTVVVNVAGPFQGQHGFKAARSSLLAGAHYVDLADGREFVCSVATELDVDVSAKAVSRSVSCGASSVPALSAAVVDSLIGGDMVAVDAIDTLITPGNQTPRGLATISAILSYVGRPIPWFGSGHWGTVPGWSQLIRRRLKMRKPEHVIRTIAPLSARWFSACDVPDLVLFPERYSVCSRVSFRAGLELSLLHLGLWLLSVPVRAGVVSSLQPLAPLLQHGANAVYSLGSDRGGMRVTVIGWKYVQKTNSPAWLCATTGDPVVPVRRSWTLLAENGDGPYVPTLAAAAAVSKLLQAPSPQQQQPIGAAPCVGWLSLQEILAQRDVLVADGTRDGHGDPRRRRLAIITSRDESGPLFEVLCTIPPEGTGRRVTGKAAYALLPPVLRRMHDVAAASTWRGAVKLHGAENALGRVWARLAGLPQPQRGDSQPCLLPLQVSVTCDDEGRETWQRVFGVQQRAAAGAPPPPLAAATWQEAMAANKGAHNPATELWAQLQRVLAEISRRVTGISDAPMVLTSELRAVRAPSGSMELEEELFGGLVRLAMVPIVRPGTGLRMHLRGMSVLWGLLRVPGALLPTVIATESASTFERLRPELREGAVAVPQGSAASEKRDVFCFDVEIRVPVLGRLVIYEGWLEPAHHDSRIVPA